jgi:phosphonate transport system substrate-binding protein
MRVRGLKIGLLFVASLVLLTACGGGGGQDEGAGAAEELDGLTLGLVPSQEAGNLAETAQPLADILSEELGVPVEAQVTTNYIGLVEAMGNEQVDIGFLNSFGYVLAKDRYPDIEPLFKAVRFGSATYRGQFAVSAESGIGSLEELEGRDIAFVDPASTSGFLFPTNELIQQGLLEEGGQPEDFFGEVIYAGGHDNALIALYNGEVDAAVSYEDARADIEEEYPDVMERIEVIEYTDEIPNDTVSVRGGLSEETVQEIEDALLAANESEEGREVLSDIYSWDDMEPAADSDYDIIRETARSLNLDLEQAAEEG